MLTAVIEESTARVVVVGAGLGGSRTCTELRKLGYAGPIVLIGNEASLPYDRPPLSKAVTRGKRLQRPNLGRAEHDRRPISLGSARHCASLTPLDRSAPTGAYHHASEVHHDASTKWDRNATPDPAFQVAAVRCKSAGAVTNRYT